MHMMYACDNPISNRWSTSTFNFVELQDLTRESPEGSTFRWCFPWVQASQKRSQNMVKRVNLTLKTKRSLNFRTSMTVSFRWDVSERGVSAGKTPRLVYLQRRHGTWACTSVRGLLDLSQNYGWNFCWPRKCFISGLDHDLKKLDTRSFIKVMLQVEPFWQWTGCE